MTVVVDWLVENRVIIWESTDRVSGDELTSGNACVRKLIANARANGVEKVQIFVDAFRCKYSPTSIWAMYQAFSYLREDTYGWHVVCVNDSLLADLCTKFAFKFTDGRIIIQTDLETGLLFLQDKDKRLPDLPQAYREWVRMSHDPAC
jgi:hypothetical protein